MTLMTRIFTDHFVKMAFE